jgi:hypothetical protein
MVCGVIESISMSAFVEGALACLRYPFLGTFFILNPLICLLIPNYHLQVPFIRFQASFLHSHWVIVFYNLVHSFSSKHERLPLEGVELMLS